MKFSLATNFDNKLIEKIKGLDVYELYGKMKEDFLSGGRPISQMKEIDKETFETHVKFARANGINFNYLLNGACTANNEQNAIWQENFISWILYLKNVGVNAFTITNPLLLILIKKHYPEAICRVSTFAKVDNLSKALYWESLGADIICADFTTINRDFSTLKNMVDGLNYSKIELLATNSCLKDCPFLYCHTNSISHANPDYIDWCLHNCQRIQLHNPEEYIKSPWIRPEDLKYYKNIGIEHIKITERDFPTEVLVARLKAYYNERYDGDLLDLIQGHGYNINGHLQSLNTKKEFSDALAVDCEIKRVRGIGKERIYPRQFFIDNSMLDGFINFFVDNNCKKDCKKCSYCKMISQKVVKNNSEIEDYLKSLYNQLDNYIFK